MDLYNTLPPLPPDQQRLFEETVEKVRSAAARLKVERLGRFTTAFQSAATPTPTGARPRQTVEVLVPVARASLVVGPQGETMKRLEKMSGATITLDTMYQDTEMKRFLVTGLPEDIEEAKRLIIDKPLNFSNYPQINLQVPQVRIGLIIGKGGETIREIQEKSGAKVIIAPDLNASEGRRDVDRQRVVTVMGEDPAVQRAKDMIEEIVFGVMRSGASSVLNTIKNSAIMQIPDTATGAVIGKRAETMKGIQEVSGARLFVDPNPIPGTNLRNVYISGPPESMAVAQQLITEKIRQIDPTFGHSYDYGTSAASGALMMPIVQPSLSVADPNATMDPAMMYNAELYGMMYAQQQQQMQMDPNAYAAYYAQYYGMDPNAYAAYYAQYAAVQGGDASVPQPGQQDQEQGNK